VDGTHDPRADPGGPDGCPLEVAQAAGNLPFVLRTVLGLSALGISTNVIGVVVVALVVAAMNTEGSAGQLHPVIVAGIVSTAVAVVIGVAAATWLQRRTLRWVLHGERPSREDAHRAVRMPLDMGVISIVLWCAGALVVGLVGAGVGLDTPTNLGIVGGTLLAGCAAAGLTNLLMARVNTTISRAALAAQPPESAPIFGVGYRLLFNWLLTSAVPLLGLVLILSAPHDKTNIVGAAIVVALLGIGLGALSTALLTRAIGTPLRRIVTALATVGEGRFDTSVEIDDPGEIGLVQSGFNQMVEGLHERERIQDLFGRHVGPSVAAQAIAGGVTLRGETREVVALFVDITGSTRLTRETEPVEFVQRLNRFFEIVVSEVEGAGGLLNKFEGDAALCVFGAPVELPDPATAALRTARAIRDRVVEVGEFEIGIGVASGPVVAGQIGAASRLEYTVIGDAVNEAARLTELAKRVDGWVLAGAAAIEAADPAEREHWRAGRALRLRGREEPTQTYRTLDGPAVPGPSLARRLGDAARVVTEFPSL
jgi:adenylate cyclase